MLNLLLSLLVCAALSVSGVSALPATPETATTTTIRNVTVGLDGSSVTLNPELEFVAAIGQNQALAHFEIRSGEDVLLPMSLELEADRARFALMNSGRAYAITDNELLGMAFDGASGKEIEQVKTVLNGLANIYYADGAMTTMLRDEELSERFCAAVLENWCAQTGADARETEVEIDGESYPARTIELHADMEELVAAVDAAAGSQDAEVAAVSRLVLEMLNQARALSGSLTDGFNLSGISPLALNEAGEAVPLTSTLPAAGGSSDARADSFLPNLEFDVELLLAEGEAVAYVKADAVIRDLDDISEQHLCYETTQRGDVTLLNYSVQETSGSEKTTMEIRGDITDVMETSAALNLTYSAEAGGTFGKDGRISVSGSVCGSVGEENDLRLDMEVKQEETLLGSAAARYADAVAADGTRNGHAELALSIADEKDPHDLSLSFDIDRAKSAPVDDFADLQELSLGDESGNGVALLRLELLGLAANAATLSAEESVLQLQELFREGFAFRWSGVTRVDQNTEYVNMYEADSVEDAAKVFEGRIPAFTPPTAYELDVIRVSPYSFYARYVNGDKAFVMDVDSYGMKWEGSSVRYAMLQEDGSLQSVSGSPVEIYFVDGAVNYVVVTREDMYIYFSFNEVGVNLTELREILAGLEP